MAESGADLQKSVKRTSNNPKKDVDLNSLGLSVAAAWKANPHITLVWITADQHEANVNSYNTTLNERLSTGGGRKEITNKLATLDTDISLAISVVKSYLVYKYGKNNAVSYYPQFGIEKKGSNFLLPADRDKRIAALSLIKDAIVANGFEKEKYGTDYWTATANSYTDLMQQAATIDGTVSNKVGTKNQLRKDIAKTHNALINVLRGNYPDTYKTILREWGFQKEKY